MDYNWQLVLFIVLMLVAMVTCSPGDRSYVYQQCLHNCHHSNCSGKRLKQFHVVQAWSEWVLGWSCDDECKYSCMWTTVEAFQKDGLKIPQFYGKWPFIRWLGMQEPASVIFSVLNGLAHLRIFAYRKYVPSSTPMYYVWHISCLTAINAWFWSAVFHSRDTPFTEKMDYFCAFSIVLYNTFTLACRLFGTARWRLLLPVFIGLLLFFIQHISYLSFNSFDYGYNMKVNISVAVFNMIGWLAWCYTMRHRPYIWKAVVAIVVIQCLLSLELLDFPPLFWTFDAHSLWHAGTPPLCLLWYSFVIDDGLYLMKRGQDMLPQKID